MWVKAATAAILFRKVVAVTALTPTARRAHVIATLKEPQPAGAEKRPGTSIMQQLLDLHKEEAATAEKAAKKSRKLMKKGLKLQKESNDMQAAMLQLMQQHFAAK